MPSTAVNEAVPARAPSPGPGARGAEAALARVVVDSPGRAIDRAFTYRVPEAMRSGLDIGSYVLVPFGRRVLPGYVVGFTQTEPPQRLREIRAVLSQQPLFGQAQLALCTWVAGYYQCSLAEALRCVVPRGIARRVRRRAVLADGNAAREALPQLRVRAPVQAKVVEALLEAGGTLEYRALCNALRGKRPSDALKRLEGKGLLNQQRALAPPQARGRRRTMAKLAVAPSQAREEMAKLRARAPRQAEALANLLAAGTEVPASKLSSAGRAPATALAAKGLVELTDVPTRRAPAMDGVGSASQVAPLLNAEQQVALREVVAGLEAPPRTVLVHGVTGSGKTEVYLGAIQEALARGKQAIVLVPEISLTPQAIARFSARFEGRLALLHSRLSQGERYDEWRRVAAGEADVVIGARSAVFSPLTRLGLIILDEEHEPAYKQESAPRYHAREVALRRAQMESAVVVMGSATPSLESYHAAEQGSYRYVRLSRRIDERPLPAVRIVDMRGRREDGQPPVLSEELREAIAARLTAREQVMLFLNRRGFSTFVMCRECGFAMRCPDCEVSLTYHARSKRLRCHHCGLREQPPDVCPQCQGSKIGYLGLGTERVEEEVRSAFEEARPLRLDRDATRRKGAYQAILQQFASGEADVLIGTQMIAKGHDFPEVTLVGVINADTGLNFPDFRAGERTFQLLTQVGGRAGRGKRPGEVLVQTYNPEHYAVVAASGHDYEVFCELEHNHRRELGYPPFSRLIAYLISDRRESRAVATAEALVEALVEHAPDVAAGSEGAVEVLGPAPAPLARIKGIYRYHVLARSADVEALHRASREAVASLPSGEVERIAVDVDPVDMM
ncbi:MAG: primosomal protein N' [Armatimonadota bacterium]